MTTRPKLDPSMLVLAVLTLALSTWGLYRLLHTFGHVPGVLAVCAVAGFDLFAVAAGRHALRLAADGDPAGPWNAAVVAVAAGSAGLQFETARLLGDPAAVGLAFAMFPVATVALFEGTLRRAHRIGGRATGRTAQPRASFELTHWLLYPRPTWTALRLAVLDRTLGADGALKLGMLQARAARADQTPPDRRTVDLDYSDILAGRAVMPGQAPPDVRELSVASGQTRSVAAAVRAALSEHPDADWPAVRAAVRVSAPGSTDDAIRRAYDRAMTRPATG